MWNLITKIWKYLAEFRIDLKAKRFIRALPLNDETESVATKSISLQAFDVFN